MPVEQIGLDDYVKREEALQEKLDKNYNPSFDTPLGRVDETLYRLWKKRYAPGDNSGTYDYRGAYAAGVMPQPPIGHWPDTFKKPSYPTFSTDSQYSGAYPERAGRWEGDQFIPPSPSPPPQASAQSQLPMLAGNPVRYEGDTAIHNVPTNEEVAPDYSAYRTFPYTPYERPLIQEQDRWTDPKLFDADQKATWERSFEHDPGWRLHKGYSNTWSYAPPEPESEQYRQGKNAMDDMTERVERLVRPDTGAYDPGFIPMRGGYPGGPGSDAGLEQLHYDPSRSMDMNLASYPGTGGQPRPAPPYPSPTPGQLPEPPGTGYGPVGQALYSAFQPEPPGTDPMSVRPMDLLRQLRQGIVSDEDLAEIKRNPASPRSLAALAQASIMLSRGAGRGENLNWHIVPLEEWNAMKTPEGLHPAYKADEAQNLYQAQGTHDVANPDGTNTSHIIAKLVGHNHPMNPEHEAELGKYEPGSPEWFQQKAVDFQAKHGLPPVEPSDKSVDPNVAHLSPQDAINHFLERQGANTDTYDATLQHIAHIQDAMDKKMKINADAAESYYTGGEHYGALLKKMGWTKDGDFYVPPKEKGNKALDDLMKNPPDTPEEYWKKYHKAMGTKITPGEKPDIGGFKPPPGEEGPNLLTPGENVGPVDWNWYTPQGGALPPYEPPFEVPPGWDIAPGDMGPHNADFWERFHWKPPPDPNSPDFPGPNRWDYQPPPE